MGTAMASLALAFGCSEPFVPPDPAPVVWVGEHVELATHGEVDECGGSREYIDAFVGAVLDDMGLEAEGKVRYYLLTDDELDEVGLEPRNARHALDGRVYTNVTVDTHELTHAARHLAVGFPPPGVTFFEEGLAALYQIDSLPLDPDRDVMAALRSVSDLRDNMEYEHYGVAGHFTSFLVSEHGIEPVVAFVDDQAGVTTLAQLETLFAEHFSESLEGAIERYRSDYPSCFHLARTRHPVECSRPPVEPDEDGYINIRYDLTCDDPEALGPVGGWMWRSFTFDVTRADGYDVSNAIMPFDFTAELVDCARGCDGSYTWSDTGVFLWAPDLEPGRHLVRFTRPVEQPGPVTIGMGRFE